MYIRNPFTRIASIPSLRVIRRVLFLVFLIALELPTSISAQWKIQTPRDTLIVPANKKTFVSTKIVLGTGVDMSILAGSTFTENDGSNTFGMDAAYTDLVNGNSLIPQVLNPPSYSGNQHLYEFTVTTVPGFNETKFVPIENSYQSSHNYSAHVASQGSKFQFRILADKDADYPRATGAINLLLARWTAGISVQYVNLDFQNVLIGSSYTQLDSIASYGVDPLQIDSIKIIDPSGLDDYSFSSERDNRFLLHEGSTDQIKITFSPSVRGLISAELHIYSHNTDPASRERIIFLTGFGIAPDFGVGPHQIDFGKVRIGFPATGSTQISNAKGNAELFVNNNSHYQQYAPTPPPTAFSFASPKVWPMIITAGSIGQIRTLFSPTVIAKYQGVLQVRGENNVPPDSVILTGEGAAPIPLLSPVPKNGALDFGIVYNGNTSTRSLTLSNKGNWTSTVLIARITGQKKAVFTFNPGDTEFIVEPDSSRTFEISFHPGTGQDSLPIQCYFELVYDDYSIDTVILNGMEIEPKVLSSNTTYNFGKVKVGAFKIDTVSTLRNVANINIGLQEEQVLPPGAFSEVGRIGSIDAHQLASYICKFAPLGPGPASAYAHFSDNGKRDSILLTGIGVIGKAIFNPSPINFGIVPSNKWDTIYTTLKDSGDYPLSVDSIKVTGQDAADFHIIWQPNGTTPNPKFTIEPDSTISIEVAFMTNALTGAVHQANLCVYYNDGTSDCISLQGIEEAQHLQFAQSSVNFGKHRIGTHSQAYGAFRNGSNKTLAVGAVTTTSSSNAFTLLDTLNPVSAKSMDSVEIDFFPQTRGTYLGYLHAFGGDIRTDSIQLHGQGAQPLPQFLPDTIVDFGIVPLGTPSTKSFALLDSGDWTLTAVKIELVSDKYGEFAYSNGGQPITSDIIQEKTSSTYQVTFTPNTTIVYHSAKMLFTFDDGTVRTVILKGYDESPKLVLDADTVNFGRVRIGLPATNYRINIVSTSPNTLTAQGVQLSSAAVAGTYSAFDGVSGQPVAGPISLTPRQLYPIDIAFKPQSIGRFDAKLIASGGDVKNDSAIAYITGIGAAPAVLLSTTILDFGSLFAGYPGSRSFTLKDSGNWPLVVLNVKVSGPNMSDFTLRNIPTQFNILEDSSNKYIVDFKASTPYQATPRTARIVFLLDDSSTFSIDLTEQDIAPIKVNLKVDNEYARIGDVVTPSLRLMNPLPDSLHILDIKGVINYDPTVVDLDRSGVVRGDALIQLGNWNLITTPTDPAGTITYELQGSGAGLSKIGSLLRMKFKPHDNDAPGTTSPLAQKSFSFPLRTEIDPQSVDGELIVDSACGATHLIAGTATADMVDQNMPNPFGSQLGNDQTLIPFDIGFDNTPVTIRILDVSGREVARPIDNRIFNQGRYTTAVTASILGNSGAYFYEFRAGDSKPVFMKMVVRK